MGHIPSPEQITHTCTYGKSMVVPTGTSTYLRARIAPTHLPTYLPTYLPIRAAIVMRMLGK